MSEMIITHVRGKIKKIIKILPKKTHFFHFAQFIARYGAKSVPFLYSLQKARVLSSPVLTAKIATKAGISVDKQSRQII